MKSLRVALPLLWACSALRFSCFAADVLTYHNDNQHTGWNPNETTLNPSNVTVSTFGLLQNLGPLDAPVIAQPLYVSNLAVQGSFHNLLIVATENDSVYAFDADSLSQTPLWKTSLLGAGEVPAIPYKSCHDLLWSNDPSGETAPALGITATPVVNRAAGRNGTIYVLAMSMDSATATNYFARLHALDLSTGKEINTAKLKSPVTIGSYPATLPNIKQTTYPSLSGTLTFNPQAQRGRAALLLQNGIIYTGWGSQCDERPFYGWIIAYNANTLTQAFVLNLNPNNPAEQGGAGVWGGGAALTGSPEGSIYFMTGDGLFDTTLNSKGFPNSGNFATSFMRVAKNLSVVDYFTPFNQSYRGMPDVNLDLGSGGVVVLPAMTDALGNTKSLAVGGGKAIITNGAVTSSPVYIVNRKNMGKYNSSDKVYQTVNLPIGVGQNGIWGSPAYFNDGTNNVIYFGPDSDGLEKYVFVNAQLTGPTVSSTHVDSNNPPTIFQIYGTTPSISSSGANASSAIVWAYENLNPPDETTNPPRYGTPVLHAFDVNLKHIYWSQQNPQDDLGQPPYNALAFKFAVPTVCNGKVFVGTTNSVAVFGLLPNPR